MYTASPPAENPLTTTFFAFDKPKFYKLYSKVSMVLLWPLNQIYYPYISIGSLA